MHRIFFMEKLLQILRSEDAQQEGNAGITEMQRQPNLVPILSKTLDMNSKFKIIYK